MSDKPEATLMQTLRDFVLHNDDFALCQWDEAAEQWVPVPYATVERAMGGQA